MCYVQIVNDKVNNNKMILKIKTNELLLFKNNQEYYYSLYKYFVYYNNMECSFMYLNNNTKLIRILNYKNYKYFKIHPNIISYNCNFYKINIFHENCYSYFL